MNSPRPKNMAASVSDRLKKIARDNGEDAMRVLIRYANERFLYRLSQSTHAEQFVLKGATLFSIWSAAPHRPTRDLDFLAHGDNSPEAMQIVFQEVCQTAVEDDGLVFLLETLKVESRRDEEAYPGLHVDVITALGNARIPLQIDLGFGDAVTPPPAEADIPGLLPDLPHPRLRAYPRETVVAEKLEVMIRMGITNSRMKDYYDLWYLSRDFAFTAEALTAAVKATFDRRGTALPEGVPLALTEDFASDTAKQAQWIAFLRRSGLTETGLSLSTVTTILKEFLMPVLRAARETPAVREIWPPGGQWHQE
jgi:predicted nucleotidyltransferase component of viral defense system